MQLEFCVQSVFLAEPLKQDDIKATVEPFHQKVSDCKWTYCANGALLKLNVSVCTDVVRRVLCCIKVYLNIKSFNWAAVKQDEGRAEAWEHRVLCFNPYTPNVSTFWILSWSQAWFG